ncbi:Hypothetical protein GbCGDNIH9_1571 [Granulibacter bethesdensis]|uniref:Uncharacterized protein n=1 Tax=Granulibacter bethesdensis TaxID=364410 RepID=A0AAC9P9B3_9PROT|nr:hypothetical protein [Granulibacter bethesdensis]APH54859.1 Hypothetical protein GbCGDNIH9_1571 [Granulibacter bethesdensis]APH62445.1 Hypothetical protein GbCGDNIH8_1571 [Granulibacter bethesdensis]
MAILRELVTLIRFQFDRSGIDEARAETMRLREEMERTAAMATKLGGSGSNPGTGSAGQPDAASGTLLSGLSVVQSMSQTMLALLRGAADTPGNTAASAAAGSSGTADVGAASLSAMAQTMRGALMQLVPAASLAMMGQFATASGFSTPPGFSAPPGLSSAEQVSSAEGEMSPLHRMLSALQPASASQETVPETSLTERIMRQAETLLLPQLPPVSSSPERTAGEPSIAQGAGDDPASAFRASLRQEMLEGAVATAGASSGLSAGPLPAVQLTEPAVAERGIDLTGALREAMQAWAVRPGDASLSQMSDGIRPGNTTQSELDIFSDLVLALKSSQAGAGISPDGHETALSLPLLLTSLLPVTAHPDKAAPSSPATDDEWVSAEAQGRHRSGSAMAEEASSLLSGLTALRAALLPSSLSASGENRAGGEGNEHREASEPLSSSQQSAGREGAFSMEADAVPIAVPPASLALPPAPLPGLAALRQVLGDMLPPVSLLRDPLHGAAEPDSIGRAGGAVSYVTNVSVGAPSISITAPSGDADTIAALAAQGVSDSLEGSADSFARQTNSGDKRSEG